MAKHTTIFDGDNALLKKKIKENEALQKKAAALAKKISKGGLQDEKKANKELFDLGTKINKGLQERVKLQKQMTTYVNNSAKANKAEAAHAKAMGQLREKEHRKEKSRFRQMMGDFRRSPVGKFLTGPQGRVGRGTGRAMAGAGRAGMSLAGGALGMLVGAAVTGYQRHIQVQQSMGGLSGMGSPRGIHKGMERRMGVRLGYNKAESAQHAALMGRATGVTGPRELQQAMRATALSGGEAAGIFGALAQGGLGFEGAGGGIAGVKKGQSKGGREFQRMIAAGMESGLKRGRLPEFFQGITKLMQEQQRVRVGEVGGADYAKTLAMWGRSGLSGLQGARGGAVLNQVNQGIRKPGGGEAGKAFMMQAMGFGRPGGGTSFYKAEKMREEGATSGNVMRVMTEVKKQFGTGQEAALTMRESLGVSLQQAEALLKLYDSSDSAEKKLKDIDEIMESSKSLEQQSVDYLKKTAGKLTRIAGRFDESTRHGAKAAKYIEQVEDWQYKLVGAMFKVVDYLEKIHGEIALFVGAWSGGIDKKRKEALDRSRETFYRAQEATGLKRQYLLASAKTDAQRAQKVKSLSVSQKALGVITGGLATRGARSQVISDLAAEDEARIDAALAGGGKAEQDAAGLDVQKQRNTSRYLRPKMMREHREAEMKGKLPKNRRWDKVADREMDVLKETINQKEAWERNRLIPQHDQRTAPNENPVRADDSGTLSTNTRHRSEVGKPK